ncbi:MAG: purine-nucleoside phosphorylase [Erysipelotrichaceae bacterium]
MSTPHNHAVKGDIAKTVLMPGDPLRAKFIAETFLENPVQFNTVRNMFGYTGTYKGKKVSVMGSGMGMPSIGIYSYELYTQYDVENIIRIGSAGGYTAEMKVYDVVLADYAWSESSYAKVQSGYSEDRTYPSGVLNEKLIQASKDNNIPMKTGGIHSSDVFYREGGLGYLKDIIEVHQCQAVEMESFALFHNANVCGKHAACLVTISDSFVTSEATTAEERQNSFTNMMKIALDAAIA